MLHTVWYICYDIFSCTDCSASFISMAKVINLKCRRVNAAANQRMPAYSSVFFTLQLYVLVDFYCLAASSFSSLWTFCCIFQLCHAILSKTYMPWRAMFSNAFSTENSLCYDTMTIETVFWFKPIMTMLLIIHIFCGPVSRLQTVNKAWRTLDNRP